jgi:hypothetical protein
MGKYSKMEQKNLSAEMEKKMVLPAIPALLYCSDVLVDK